MTLRAIQVGVGGRGNVWSRGIEAAPGWQLAAMSDLAPEKLAAEAEHFGVPPDARYADYREAFAAVEADAAVIVTPLLTHFEIAAAALEAGLHVLVEKPMVASHGQAVDLVKLARRAGRVAMAVQNYRYAPTTVLIKQLLDSGRLGRPYSVRVDFHRNRPCRPGKEDEPCPLLFIQSVHHLDALRYLFGGDPETVYAALQNPPEISDYGDATVLEAVYRWADGLVVSYGGSYVTQGRTTGYAGLWRIECTKGVIYLGMLAEGERVLLAAEPDGEPELAPLPAELPMPEVALLADLERAVRTGAPPPTAAADNLHTLAMIFAAVESSRTGRIEAIARWTDVP